MGEEGLVAAFARRVDDDGGLGRRKNRVEAGKIVAASPDWKETLAMALAAAFWRAKRMEDSLSSMPATRSKAGAALRANRPLPQ